jgi:hypothetical protein
VLDPEKAVHRLLLIIEERNGDGQLGQQKIFQMRVIQIYQRQPFTHLAQPRQSKHQSPQPSAVNVADILEIQDYIDLAGLTQCGQPVTKFQISWP